MKNILTLLVLSSGSLLLHAEISGVVTNATTGAPQAGVSITLIHPGENGMQTLATTKSDAEGKFTIDQALPPPPALLRAEYQGVEYNQVVPPNAPTTGVRLNVFDATAQIPSASLTQQHLVVLEPLEDGIRVNETFLLQNGGKTTMLDPVKGSAQFFLPKSAQGSAKVTIEAPNGMPITRAPEKTSTADVFKVGYPVKPGETVFEIAYTLPPSKKFDGKLLGKDPLLLVTPEAVQLSGAGLKEQGIKDLGQNGTRARVYQVSGVAGASYEVDIDGIGALQTEQPEAQRSSEDGSPKPKAGPARLHERLPWVLGLTFSILALGGTILYRRSPV